MCCAPWNFCNSWVTLISIFEEYLLRNSIKRLTCRQASVLFLGLNMSSSMKKE